MLTCEMVAKLVSQSLERKLGILERLGIKVHMLLCAWCREHGQQMLLLHDIALQYGEVIERSELLPADSLPDEVREQIKQMLRSGGE